MRNVKTLLAGLFLASAFYFGFATCPTARASDHGDAPNVDNDSGADIADLFAFLDPNDNTQVIVIGDVHGFIVPGEAGSFAKFDPSVQYRFDLEQTGDAKPDASVFTRGRNSFAGYNLLGIAFSFPIDLIRGKPTNNSIGFQFVTSRRTQTANLTAGGYSLSGPFRQIDRAGNPAVNVALIPFAKKSLDNASTPLEDSKGKFEADIVATLKSSGTDDAHIAILAGVAVTKGDFLRLDLTQPNTGTGGGTNTAARFPNVRRLADDSIDILLTLIGNGTPAPNNGVATGIAGTLGDSVDAADMPPQNQFPFLALPHQPYPTGTLDDATRN